MTDDGFSTWAGPYVLGALSPGDRSTFEAHLPGCRDCTAAVGELAGMPGLLSRVPLDAVAALDEPGSAPPDTLLPSLLRAVRRRRLRTRWVTGGLGALVAAGVAAAAVVVFSPGGTQPAEAGQRPMQLLVSAPLSATASVTAVAWGSRIDVRCRYDGPVGSGAADGAEPAYELVVTDRTGHQQELGTWAVRPGAPASVTGATALRPADIAAVEVQSSTGRTLLRLTE